MAGLTAYVPNLNSDNVSVVNLVTNTLITTISLPVGSMPYGSVVNNEAIATKAYITNSGNGTVSVIDTILNEVIAIIPVGNNPRPIAINEAGTFVYVGNFDDDSISVIDTLTNTVVETLNGISSPAGLVTNSSAPNTFLYVTNFDDDTVTVLDITAPLPVVFGLPIGVGTNPIGIDIDVPNRGGLSRFIYIANFGSDTVTVINVTNPLLPVFFTTISVGIQSQPFGVGAFSSPGGSSNEYIFITNSGSSTISQIDPSIFDTFPVIPPSPFPVSGTPMGISNGVTLALIGYALSSTDLLGRTNDSFEIAPPLAIGDNPISLGHFVGITPLASPTLTTDALASATLGESIDDSATLSGGVNPTGTITFTLYGPNDGTCSMGAIFIDIVPVNGNGMYQSAPFVPPSVGTYNWIANYSGDINNNPTNNQCGEDNEFSEIVPPTFRSLAKSFDPFSAPVGTTHTLTITIVNNEPVAMSGISFTDNYPAGIINVSAPFNNTMGGLATSTPTSLSLVGGSIAAFSTGMISINVQALAPGTYENSTGPVIFNVTGSLEPAIGILIATEPTPPTPKKKRKAMGGFASYYICIPKILFDRVLPARISVETAGNFYAYSEDNVNYCFTNIYLKNPYSITGNPDLRDAWAVRWVNNNWIVTRKPV